MKDRVDFQPGTREELSASEYARQMVKWSKKKTVNLAETDIYKILDQSSVAVIGKDGAGIAVFDVQFPHVAARDSKERTKARRAVEAIWRKGLRNATDAGLLTAEQAMRISQESGPYLTFQGKNGDTVGRKKEGGAGDERHVVASPKAVFSSTKAAWKVPRVNLSGVRLLAVGATLMLVESACVVPDISPTPLRPLAEPVGGERQLPLPQVIESVRPELVQGAVNQAFPDFEIKIGDVEGILKDSSGERYVFARSRLTDKKTGQELDLSLLIKLGPNNQIDFVKWLVTDEKAPPGEILEFWAVSYDNDKDTLVAEGELIRTNTITGDIEIFRNGVWGELIGPEEATEEIQKDLGIQDSLVSFRLNEMFQEKVEVASILDKIKQKYGIEIPNEVSEEFSEEIYSRNSEEERILFEVRPNALLTLGESKIVAETLEQIPGVDYLVQLIIPFRVSERNAGGASLGYQWPVFLHRDDYNSFPYDRFISEEAAIELNIPDNIEMTDALPTVGEDFSNAVLTSLLQISLNSAGIEAKTDIEVPWTTYGERLSQVLVHETGHSLLSQALLANTGYDVEEYWRRQTFTIYNMNTWDIENPILETFAQVNGWELVPCADFVRQYVTEDADTLIEEYPEMAQKAIWDRDSAVWGELADRKIRITPYASYGPIQEAFCEFWMASILYPELLTPEEREFFQKIHQGLREDPEAFIQSIVEDPGILLAED